MCVQKRGVSRLINRKLSKLYILLLCCERWPPEIEHYGDNNAENVSISREAFPLFG